MRPRALHLPFRVTRHAIAAMVVAIIVAVTGFEAAVHAHIPVADGWHDETPHGDSAGDRGLNPCSICRLAHETSPAPVALGTVSAPLSFAAPRVIERSTLVLEVATLEHSPRAPPCLASC